MKTFLLMMVLIFSISIGHAQTVQKGRATAIAFKEPGKSWSKYEPCSVLMVFTDKRIVIYSETPKTFDVVGDVEKAISTTTASDVTVLAVDENGTTCKLQITGESGVLQLYVIYSDIRICYQFEKI